MPLAKKMLLEFLHKSLERKLGDTNLLPFVDMMKCEEDFKIIISLRNWPVIALGERDMTRTRSSLTRFRTPLIEDCKQNLELGEVWSATNINVICPKLETEEFGRLERSSPLRYNYSVNVREGSDQKDFGKATSDPANEECESVLGDEKLLIPPFKKNDSLSDPLTDRSEDFLQLDSAFEHSIGMRRINWKILRRIMLNHPRNA